MQVAAGNLIEEAHYYAYGLKIAAISSVKLGDGAEGGLKNNNLYNDKELIDDADLNWYDYGFRNYDPQTGRFMQIDPLAGNLSGISPYACAFDDPITNIDVLGLSPFDWVKGVTAAGAVYAGTQELAGVIIKSTVKTVTHSVSTASKIVNATNHLRRAMSIISIGVHSFNIYTQMVGVKVLNRITDKITSDFYSGNDQKGAITSATPQMRKEHPVAAAVHQLAYNVEDFFGFNGMDDAIANLRTGKFTAGKAIDLTEAAFNFGASLGGEEGLLGEGERVSEGIAGGESGNSSSEIWTSTKNSSSLENALNHWEKHGSEFSEYKNASDYIEGAKNFLHNSPQGTLTKVRANGDILKYNPSTNTFGVMDASGSPRTMFKPNDGMKYWLKQ